MATARHGRAGLQPSAVHLDDQTDVTRDARDTAATPGAHDAGPPDVLSVVYNGLLTHHHHNLRHSTIACAAQRENTIWTGKTGRGERGHLNGLWRGCVTFARHGAEHYKTLFLVSTSGNRTLRWRAMAKNAKTPHLRDHGGRSNGRCTTQARLPSAGSCLRAAHHLPVQAGLSPPPGALTPPPNAWAGGWWAA